MIAQDTLIPDELTATPAPPIPRAVAGPWRLQRDGVAIELTEHGVAIMEFGDAHVRVAMEPAVLRWLILVAGPAAVAELQRSGHDPHT